MPRVRKNALTVYYAAFGKKYTFFENLDKKEGLRRGGGYSTATPFWKIPFLGVK